MTLTYKRSEKVIKARQKLRELQEDREAAQVEIETLARKVQVAKEAYDLAAAKYALDSGTKLEVEEAKAALDLAIQQRDAAVQKNGQKRGSQALDYVMDQLEVFKQAEREENLKIFEKPYIEALQTMDRALRDLAAAVDNVQEITAAAAPLSLPGAYVFRDVADKAAHWRESVKQYGFIL